MDCACDATAACGATPDPGAGLRPGPLLRGNRRNHGVPCQHGEDADVPRARQVARDPAAARRDSMCLDRQILESEEPAPLSPSLNGVGWFARAGSDEHTSNT